MNRHEHCPAQLADDLFLTDGGIETTMIFHESLDLPYFAAFHLLRDAPGTAALRNYYARHAAVARDNGVGFILESATWRASPDWGEKLGHTPPYRLPSRPTAHCRRATASRRRSKGSTPRPIQTEPGTSGRTYRAQALVGAKPSPLTILAVSLRISCRKRRT